MSVFSAVQHRGLCHGQCNLEEERCQKVIKSPSETRVFRRPCPKSRFAVCVRVFTFTLYMFAHMKFCMYACVCIRTHLNEEICIWTLRFDQKLSCNSTQLLNYIVGTGKQDGKTKFQRAGPAVPVRSSEVNYWAFLAIQHPNKRLSVK